MEILRIGTVNVAVKDATAAGNLFRNLGLSVPNADLVRLEEPPAQIRYLTAPVGDSSISFVEPSDATSPIARFLAKRGEGLFSLSLEVRGLEELMQTWAAQGVKWVLDKPMAFEPAPGRPEGGAVNWTKPASTCGLLIEVIERRAGSHKLD